ncbi:MAG TPA: serine/threonine-protein kinase [Thermoanaerobaculia bacterium]|nr:serine/threonine-protein kinase [Thermoanaerobaculia bacterium]
MRWLPDGALDHLKEVASEPDLAGTPYEIVGTIGQGGMGTVYLARDRDLDREVALKVVQLHQEDTERLLREARILARLEHPGIVPVHDVGVLPDGRAWYVMKRVRGSRLDRSLSLPDRLRAFERICEAVAFAHAHGVIHRDLKPENVMVGPFGEVLVMDWGVARLQGTVEAPSIMGTPGYMAPEQERGEMERIDERTDVYALGAILSFLLEGEDRVPRPLAAVRSRAMAAEPEGRYSNVRELSADLGRYLDGLPVAAYRESLLEQAARLFRRYRAPILIVLAYLLMRALLILILGR